MMHRVELLFLYCITEFGDVFLIQSIGTFHLHTLFNKITTIPSDKGTGRLVFVVHSFIPKWKENLVVLKTRSDFESFLERCRPLIEVSFRFLV